MVKRRVQNESRNSSVCLGVSHFHVPTACYTYLSKFCDISTVEIADKDKPRITIVVPCNEGPLIVEKLNDLINQQYGISRVGECEHIITVYEAHTTVISQGLQLAGHMGEY
jgi:hypothetical protein